MVYIDKTILMQVFFLLCKPPKIFILGNMEKKLKDIRKHIDTLDSQLLELLAKRQYWVEQAGDIKQERDKVYDEARVNEILDKIKQEAKQKGISEDIVLPLWEKLLQLSVAHEFTHYDKKKSPTSKDD